MVLIELMKTEIMSPGIRYERPIMPFATGRRKGKTNRALQCKTNDSDQEYKEIVKWQRKQDELYRQQIGNCRVFFGHY